VLGAGRLDPLQTGFSASNRLYETADGWICVVAEHPTELEGLARVTGVESLAGAGGAPGSGDRTAASDPEEGGGDYERSRALADVFCSRGTTEWLDRLESAGVPAARPVPHNNLAAMHDPELRRTGRVAEVLSPEGYGVREIAMLVRVTGATVPPYRLAPGLGEHTDAILSWLGCPDTQIAWLRARGAVR
jgi:crotonobetainyl-CoA:carnitine CoA-transferase CaiB-like acyl-CoA transferase